MPGSKKSAEILRISGDRVFTNQEIQHPELGALFRLLRRIGLKEQGCRVVQCNKPHIN